MIARMALRSVWMSVSKALLSVVVSHSQRLHSGSDESEREEDMIKA